MMNARMVALGITAGVLGVFVAGTAALGGPQANSSSAVGAESGERTVEDGGTGPYKAVAVSNSSISTHTIYRPKDLSAFGDREKLPILAWGNGGCANSNSAHQNYLSEIASHGYLIVAIGPMQAGGGARWDPALAGLLQAHLAGAPVPSGGTLLDAINWATAQNTNPQSPYYRKIDTSKVAVSAIVRRTAGTGSFSRSARQDNAGRGQRDIEFPWARSRVHRQPPRWSQHPVVHQLEHPQAEAARCAPAAI